MNEPTDYLVVGAGAMGMAFTDVLMSETEASVVMVDKHHQPGGHWNDAYPFVRLHQPSAFYGVNSRQLGDNALDTQGWNKGLYELATNSEVCAYFGQVMERQFLPSGRVRYHPLSEHLGDGRCRSLASGREWQVQARTIVDATYMDVQVPATSAPPFAVAEGVSCAPLNALPQLVGRHDRYVIVGAGKTGMDACLFLLAHGVAPAAITWIMPRDAWLLDRANIQPGAAFANAIATGFAQQLRGIAEARDLDDLFQRMEACGQLLRLDPKVRPTMYRCATVTQMELKQLRRIQNLVRLGRVRRISEDAITLEGGDIATTPSALHVHCAADGLARRPAVPVFAGNRITCQSVRTCQQVFSAAFIAHVQVAYQDEGTKNKLCTVVPHPNSDIDFVRTTLGNSLNQMQWAQDADLQAWLHGARLDGFSPSPDAPPEQSDPGPVLAAIARMRELLGETDAAQRAAQA